MELGGFQEEEGAEYLSTREVAREAAEAPKARLWVRGAGPASCIVPVEVEARRGRGHRPRALVLFWRSETSLGVLRLHAIDAPSASLSRSLALLGGVSAVRACARGRCCGAGFFV